MFDVSLSYGLETKPLVAVVQPQPGQTFDRTLYRVRHWFEYGRTFEGNRPEVNRLEPFHGYDMNSAMQWYWYRLLAWSRYGYYLLTNEEADYIVNAFQGVTHPARAFTNKSFSGVNYITGDPGDGSMNTADTIVCGGNVLAGEIVTVKGRNYLQVETIDAEKPLKSLEEQNPATHPWLYNWATIATKTPLPGGGMKVINFPQLQKPDGSYCPVWVPLASNHSRGPMLFPVGGTEYTDGWVSYLEEIPAGQPIPPAVNVG